MFKFAALALMLAFSSCAGGAPAQEAGSVVGATPAQVQQTIDTAKAGMISAHNAHRFAADLCKALATSGILHGDAASKASDLLTRSEDVLKVGDAAIAVGDAPGALQAIKNANDLVAKIHTVIGQ